ncbi:YciI family protein [Geothrix sp. PMB-07]|uniref:YciI family protein n=1 Tax=Geothrix sp. PMB-07 TaxID=3068640 RepID=UPI002740C3C7|nr:YciI family protein [Geothrix sp. PMB-07]WLT30318.1 YciI family protein [Geothrix sp. PMB-07]
MIIVRYRKPLAEVEAVTEAHRAYLRDLQAKGVLVASGPLEPRFGGMWMVRVQDENPLADLDALRDGDPFYQHGLANYELLPWKVMQGKDGLDAI